jgi:hypothetical protein
LEALIGRTHALRSSRISLANVVSDGRDIRDRAPEASSIEAAKGGFDIRRKLAALRLGQAFQHIGKVSRVDRFGLGFVAREAQHRPRHLILAIRQQAPHGFQGSFE